MMEYRNDSVRRQDRLLDEERARELLRGGEYGFLAMASDEGGYGIPVNYVAEGDTIYIHCAPEGRKLRAIAADARVSFCVVGVTRPVPDYAAVGEKYIDKSFHRTAVIAIDAEWWSGKTKRV